MIRCIVLRLRLSLLVATPAAFVSIQSTQAANLIYIDAGTSGSVSSIAIQQDAASGSNTLSGAGGSSTPFTVSGAWGSLAVTQAGANNTLQGNLTDQVTGTGSNDFRTTMTGGHNTIDTMIYADTGAVGNIFQLQVTGNTNVQYGVYSTASGSSVSASINNVAGGGVYVEQTGTGSNASVDLTVNGGGYTLGTTASNPVSTSLSTFFAGAGPGIAVYQSGFSPIAATVTPSTNGYTATITHGP